MTSKGTPVNRTLLGTEPGAATAAHDASRTSSSYPLHAAARPDPSAPHLARVYAYWVGGKDHFSADRKVAEEVLDHRPQVATAARAMPLIAPGVVPISGWRPRPPDVLRVPADLYAGLAATGRVRVRAA